MIKELPDYWDIVKKEKHEGLTALEQFILDNEPAGSDDVKWRAQLLAVLQDGNH